jgi:hypothetical protein
VNDLPNELEMARIVCDAACRYDDFMHANAINHPEASIQVSATEQSIALEFRRLSQLLASSTSAWRALQTLKHNANK